MISNNHLGLYREPPAKKYDLPVVRKSSMSTSFDLKEGMNSSGRLKLSSRECGLIEPLSLWCLEYPEYFRTFERITSCLMTRRNSCPFRDTYCEWLGKETKKGIFPNLSLIVTLGIPCDLALKQAIIVGSAITPGEERKNSNSSLVNSSQSHFPKSVRTIVPNFPEEKIRNLSAVPLLRSVDTVIFMVLNPPRLGKFSLILEWSFRLIIRIVLIPMTLLPRSLSCFPSGELYILS